MNKDEIRREEAQQEHEDDMRAEQLSTYCVKFKGSVYIEAVDKDDAIEKAEDNPDILEHIDEWDAE